MTDRLDKVNVSKEVSPPIHQYIPVIIGVVVAVVAAVLFLLIFYFCMWRKQKRDDVESSLEATPSFNKKISIVGQELNPNWMVSNEDSAVLSSVGHSSFPAQFTSDEPSDTGEIAMTSISAPEDEVEIAMTSVETPEDETNSNLQDLKDDGCSPSSVQEQQSCHGYAMTMSTQQNANNPSSQVVDAANDSVLCEEDCKTSKDVLSITGQGFANPSPISVKLKQKLIQRKRAQEESNSAAPVSSYSLDENEVVISFDEQDPRRAKKALNYDNKNLDQDAISNGMPNEINEDINYEKNSSASKGPENNLSHESRCEEEHGDILPIESPDGKSKELDWDSTHEPLKTRSSALKLVCTPSQPKLINVTPPNSNLEESTIEEEIDVEAANSDDECHEAIQELDWDSSHEPLKTRKSVLKLVVPQNQ